MAEAAAKVHDNFKSKLEICGFYENTGYKLVDQWIRMTEYLSLATISLLKTTSKLLRYSDPLVNITEMVDNKIYTGKWGAQSRIWKTSSQAISLTKSWTIETLKRGRTGMRTQL